MAFIKAFEGFLVKPEHALTVVSPAYDSVSPQQRQQFANANPHNFINTMRLQEDYPEDNRPTQDELLKGNHARLHHLLKSGVFHEFAEPSMYIYQLGTDQHLQTGIVCEVSVEDYKNGRLRKHENTRASKEDLLARYQEVVGAASSPICLTYPRSHAIDEHITGLMQNPPELHFSTADNETQRVWRVTDSQAQLVLQNLFDQVEQTYLTDGHHRAASGLRYAELMQKKHGTSGQDLPHNRMLVALFPDNQLNLLPFHRCVKDTNNLNKWYQLKRKPMVQDDNNPVRSLDVSILQDDILDPILGINDLRDDSRLGYIAGVAGDEGILQAAREGWKIVFTCYATSIGQLMEVADANELMPPKSTYFDPKPRSGIFVRLK